MIGTDIIAVYTIVPDAHTVRIWAFAEKDFYPRLSLLFLIVDFFQYKFPSEFIYFEFHLIPHSKPPFEVEIGGFWTYFQHKIEFSGEPMLVPASDKFLQEWRERTGQKYE